MENKTFFSEQQRFKQIWLWALILGITVLFLSGLVSQVYFGHKFGSNPMSNTTLIIVTISTFFPALLLICMRLDTEIRSDGIYVRFFPLQMHFSFYSWDNFNQCFVREYSPIGEFGGWGIRGIGKNKALNISGNKGIQLVMKDGSKLLIGTNKIDEAIIILKQLGRFKE
jgi:hypothetical protein